MLTIALPKGKIAKETFEIFAKILKKKFDFEDRKFILEYENFRFLLVRNQDVPLYVLHQSADLGVVGLDVLEEGSFDILRLLDLGIGKCKVCVGVLDDSNINFDLPEVVIATKLSNIAKKYFSKKAIPIRLIKLYGSIELAPNIGLCDAIVDLVQTGQTMRQNGLKVIATIMNSSAYLISNKDSFITKRNSILGIYEKLKKAITN